MNAERVRSLLLALPYVVETVQWGDNLVFWVGDKAIGGKMFALLSLDAAPGAADSLGHCLISFAAATPAAYDDLLEREGLVPAPYLARIRWVAVKDWAALSNADWQELLVAAHARVLANHTAKVIATLALPAREQQRQIVARRKLLAERAAAKSAKSPEPAAAKSRKPQRSSKESRAVDLPELRRTARGS